MSDDLVRRRLLDHINDETIVATCGVRTLQEFFDDTTFTGVFATGEAETRALERHAINTWNPPTNRR